MSQTLVVENLDKRFGGVRALEGCSLSVEEGGITGLVGPNGSGKSTLINCVAGVLKPDGGRIILNGTHIERLSVAARARRGIGRTFQTTRLFHRLTVDENVRAAGLLNGRLDAAFLREAYEYLAMFKLDGFRRSRAGDLSYGQQKLLELVLVIATKPAIALLDEPAAGVNPVFLDSLGEHLIALRRDGMTFLIVEHNIQFLVRIADELYVLDDGKNLASGPPREIVEDPRVLSVYLGQDSTGEQC